MGRKEVEGRRERRRGRPRNNAVSLPNFNGSSLCYFGPRSLVARVVFVRSWWLLSRAHTYVDEEGEGSSSSSSLPPSHILPSLSRGTPPPHRNKFGAFASAMRLTLWLIVSGFDTERGKTKGGEKEFSVFTLHKRSMARA